MAYKVLAPHAFLLSEMQRVDQRQFMLNHLPLVKIYEHLRHTPGADYEDHALEGFIKKYLRDPTLIDGRRFNGALPYNYCAEIDIWARNHLVIVEATPKRIMREKYEITYDIDLEGNSLSRPLFAQEEFKRELAAVNIYSRYRLYELYVRRDKPDEIKRALFTLFRSKN